MKNKNVWLVLIVIAAFLSGIVAVYELKKGAPELARAPTTVISPLETYFQTPDTYRSIGAMPELLYTHNMRTYTTGGMVRYKYVLGMKPGTGNTLNFDVFVILATLRDVYPEWLDIFNGLNAETWEASQLQLSFTVGVDGRSSQGMPGHTHEIIYGHRNRVSPDWATQAAGLPTISGDRERDTFISEMGKIRNEAFMTLALIGDEAFVSFFIQSEVDTSGSFWKNLTTQFKSGFRGRDANAFSYYMVSAASLAPVSDCGEIDADEPAERTAVSGKTACTLGSRASARRNHLDGELSGVGISSGMKEVIFEELGI